MRNMCTKVTGYLYRSLGQVTAEERSAYCGGHPMQWLSFTSCSSTFSGAWHSASLALVTARRDGQVEQPLFIVRLTALEAYAIAPFSFFPTEDECVLLPASEFVVSGMPISEDHWVSQLVNYMSQSQMSIPILFFVCGFYWLVA